MKQSLSLLAFGLAAVRAQAPSSLPQCGQTCVNNMLQIAVSNFGCDANNLAACACCNANFGYGIRDCSRQVCGDGSQDYSSVVSYGSSYCASAVTSCPSGTHATSALATGTSGGSSGTGSGSGSSGSMPTMTSGGLAGAVGGIRPVSGSSNAYVVGSTTITAGGDAASSDGTAYTALPSGAGVLVSGSNAQTTYVPGGGAAGSSGGSGMMTMTSGGGLGAAAGAVRPVSGSPNQYVVGSQTISAGGNAASANGTTYTALPSMGGVEVMANGASTTVNPASGSASSTGSSGGGAGGAGGSGASSTSGGSGGSGGSSEQSSGGSGGSGGGSSSSGSGNFAPIQTAAPALIGAAAMAVFAL